MNPKQLIEKYYPQGTRSHRTLLAHSIKVAEKATVIAKELAHNEIDINFVHEAALLHDIGIFATFAPDIGCYGHLPYLCHGVAGSDILIREGLPRHARLCERHIGVGLSAQEIRDAALPLPLRDMAPETLEEQIVAYADLFFSKGPRSDGSERSVEKVRRSLSRHGDDKVAIFDRWHDQFHIG